MNTKKQMSGKKLVPIFLGAIVILAMTINGLWLWQKNTPGDVVLEREFGEDMLRLRELRGQKGYVHLSRERGDETVWRQTLFKLQKPHSLLFDDEMVFVRVHDARGKLSTATFSLEDGEPRWVGARSKSTVITPRFSGKASFVGKEKLVEAYGGDTPEVIVVSKKDGQEIARIALPSLNGEEKIEKQTGFLSIRVGEVEKEISFD